MAAYDNVRSTVLQSGSDTRVEVNQRALIDKVCLSRPRHISNPCASTTPC